MRAGYYGPWGGAFIPEVLHETFRELTAAFERAQADPEFWQEYVRLMSTYSCRPTPLTFAENLTRHFGGARIYIKREDLNHTGAHKANNVMGQGLLVRRMGKTRVIAETGAGQHGVATATMAAKFGLELHDLHGRGGRRAPAPERLLDGEARRRGGAGDRRLAHAQGRDQRGVPRLGRPHGRHALRDGHGLRAAPLPGDGRLVPVDHRQRGARADPRRRPGGSPRGSTPASAAARTPWASSRASSTTRRSSWSASRPAGKGSPPGMHAARLAGGRRLARGRAGLQDDVPAERRRPDARHALGRRRARLRRGLADPRATSPSAAGCAWRRRPTPRCWRRST